MQPHRSGSDAIDHPFCIVHDMDRFDNHRELVLVNSSANIQFPIGTKWEVIFIWTKYDQGKTLSDEELAVLQSAVKDKAKVTPNVAFAQFGKRNEHPVVPALMELRDGIANAVELFALEV
jgi:hypothetical protein